MKKSLFSGLVLALVTASTIVGFAQSSAKLVSDTKATQSAPITTMRRGVIKTINDSSAVVVPSDNKKSEITYALTSATKRSGALAAGDSVAVTYYIDKGQPVVTELAGKGK